MTRELDRLRGQPGRKQKVPREVLHALLRAREPLAVDQVAELAGLSPKAVHTWAGAPSAPMVEAQLVSLEQGHARGEKPKLQIGPGCGVVLAIGIGGESVVAGLVDATGRIHGRVSAGDLVGQFADDSITTAEKVLNRIRSAAHQALSDAISTKPGHGQLLVGGRLKLIGVTSAWPCAIDRDGRPVNSLPLSWRRTSLRDRLSETLGLPQVDLTRTHAMNDASASVLDAAYAWDGAVGDETIMSVHVAAGIGLGTAHLPIRRENELPFVRAHLVGGTAGVFAGEIGHTKIDTDLVRELNEAIEGLPVPYGPLDINRTCLNCGRDGRGHVEAVIGARAVLERFTDGRYQPGGSLVSGLADLLRNAATGDTASQNVLRDVGRILARALDGAVAASDPAELRLTGTMACESIAEGMRERIAYGNLNNRLTINVVPADDRTVVAMRGAALAVLRAGLYRGFFENLHYDTSSDAPHAWDRWAGWDSHVPGVQDGVISAPLNGRAAPPATETHWRYKPLDIKGSDLALLSRPKNRPTRSTPRSSTKATTRKRRGKA